jgi:hypothetical protein
MKHQYLFRALRKIEIEENNILIPKQNNTNEFKAAPVFGIDMTFPIDLGSTRNAVRQHQWNQNGLPTRGISTTPSYERSLFYAQTNRIIVKIDTSLFEKFNIKTYDVNEILGLRTSDIAVPEDNEIIITYDKEGAFPKEIIAEIIEI